MARAMANMGVDKLTIVPARNKDLRMDERALDMATAAAPILENAASVATVEEAVAQAQIVIGTTARKGKHRPALAPEALAAEIAPYLPVNRVALLFGPESSGLTNEELRLCRHLITIPTRGSLASLNLSQAVLVILYALSTLELEASGAAGPELARRQDVEGMFAQLEAVLDLIGYFDGHESGRVMASIQRVVNGMDLGYSEVRIIRGICRQIQWFVGMKGK